MSGEGTAKPRISLLCPSYNHERYVDEFIRSVLAQTCPDWELVIVDDASSDRTAERVASYGDPRIRRFRNVRNSGINAGLNLAFSESRAPVVALTASDDALMPDYVQSVLDEFGRSPESSVLCVPLQPMDESGKDIPGLIKPDISGLGAADVCRELFLKDNFLQSPGMAMRRSVAEKVFPLPRSILPMQDVLVNLLATYFGRLAVLPEPHVRYRMSGTSISRRFASDSFFTQIYAETQVVLSRFAEAAADSPADFAECFAKDSAVWGGGAVDARTVPFWLAAIASRSRLPARRVWGLQALLRFWDGPGNEELLFKLHGFSYKNLRKLVAEAPALEYYDDRAKGVERKEILHGISLTRDCEAVTLRAFGIRLRFKRRAGASRGK